MKSIQCPVTLPRFSEKTFRRYEPFLRELTWSYPNAPVVFKPEFGSLNTHTARIRDAYSSLIANDFTTDINIENLKVAWNATIVKHDGEKILIGTREQLTSQDIPELQVQKHFTGLTIDSPTTEVFIAFCTLLQADVLNKASIKFTNIPPSLTTSDLEDQFPNVIFDYIDSTTVILI